MRGKMKTPFLERGIPVSRITTTFGRSALGAALVGVAVLAAACGSSSSTPATTTTTIPSKAIPVQSKDAAIAALVPSSVAMTGQLTQAMDATYPPDEFIAPGTTTIVGMDADLGTAIAQVLGLKPVLQNVTFGSIIAGLQAGKYDIGNSSFTDTLARQQSVNFVDYFTAGEAFYVKKGSGMSFNGLKSLCGHTVAVETGTVEQTDSQAASLACKKAGHKAVTTLSFADQNSVNLAVASGRADVGFADSQVAGYVVAQSGGEFMLTGTAFNVAPYGIAVPKGSTLDVAIQAAMKKLVSNGIYTEILKKWGTESGSVSSITINGATS